MLRLYCRERFDIKEGAIHMDADHCVCCGTIIPEGTQVCINCLNGCVNCGWDDKENCKACKGGEQRKASGTDKG